MIFFALQNKNTGFFFCSNKLLWSAFFEQALICSSEEQLKYHLKNNGWTFSDETMFQIVSFEMIEQDGVIQFLKRKK